jgi:cytochrome P450
MGSNAVVVKDADVARVLSPLLAEGPHQAAARLLAEPERVYRADLPGGERIWVVSRYDDVRQLLADPRLALDKRMSRGGYRGFELPSALDANLLNMDGADHARIRRLVVSAFTARRVASLGEGIQMSCDALIDAFPPDGAADLLEVYAAPLPVGVICDLLGVPGLDGAALRECTQVLLTPAKFGPADAVAAVGRIIRVLGALIAAKRSESAGNLTTGDVTDGDLLSAMITARDGADRLSEDELLSLAFLILFAGYENSVHLITAATARLLAEPERAARVRAQPSPHTPQMEQFVEEFLRDDQPVTNAIRRFPTEDINVGGTIIPAGDIVYLAISAANRDAEAAARNTDGSPAETHLSFGHGPHYCLGASLARLETRIALWTLFHRLPDLALAVPPAKLSWKTDHRQHVLRSLPITYSPPLTQST